MLQDLSLACCKASVSFVSVYVIECRYTSTHTHTHTLEGLYSIEATSGRALSFSRLSHVFFMSVLPV